MHDNDMTYAYTMRLDIDKIVYNTLHILYNISLLHIICISNMCISVLDVIYIYLVNNLFTINHHH